MAKYEIAEVWTSGNTWTHPKGGDLLTYFLTLKSGEKIMTHQRPETPAPKQEDEIEGEILPETNQKGTHHKFKKAKKFPDLVCPCGCNYSGPLEDFRPTKKEEGATQKPPSDDQPPAENYDQIPF